MYLLELGGEDDAFAAGEAGNVATDVSVVAPGLATARGITDRVAGLAFTRRASALVGRTDPGVASARSLLEAAPIERTGSVAVRARDVRRSTGVDTRHAERALGGVLVDRGFEVDLEDPDHELRACFSEGICALGWLVAESVRDYGERAPSDRPFVQPGSMDPLVARALVNLAGARPGTTVVDPMCGTGGLLVEAGLVGACVLGVDAQAKMARGAARNLEGALRENDDRLPDPDPFAVVRGDATAVPVPDSAADAVVFDAPYGRQSKIAGRSLEDLVAGALAEARRIAPRAVVVGDRPYEAAGRDAGWTVADRFERRVHRSLVRHVHVLDSPVA